MRASLPHALSERRGLRRGTARRRGGAVREADAARRAEGARDGAAPAGAAAARLSPAPAREPAAPDLAAPDPAAQRVRAAGGPLDQACYTCACGVVFAAEVTTTVACPRCGGAQAW
jgi:hypothetical protein